MRNLSLRHYIGIALACAAAAHVAAPQAFAQARSPSLQPSEVRFLQGLYQDVIANQRMAEMAANQGQHRSVRQLGTNVGRDLRHSREDIQLLARKKRVSLSSTLTAQNRRPSPRVSNAPTRSFDRTYVETLQAQISRILTDLAGHGDLDARRRSESVPESGHSPARADQHRGHHGPGPALVATAGPDKSR